MDRKWRGTLVAWTLAFMLTSCASAAGGISGPGECVVAPPADRLVCTMQYEPVCGCDGKTYGNACSARASGVPRSVPGACDGPGYD